MSGMTRPISVVHLLSADLWAGAEVATFHLVRALTRRTEVDVRVVTLNHGELTQRLERSGVPVEVEPEAGRSFASLLPAVRRRLAGADLVHAHRYKENLLAALSGRPWLSTQHGRPEPVRSVLPWARNRVYGELDRWVKRRSARTVIAVSKEIEVWLGRQIGSERVLRSWNGIDDPIQGEVPIPWTERPLRVGIAARLSPVKNVELAIDAISACPGIELEIVGDGPEREHLERQIEALGASQRIRLLGFTQNPHPLMKSWRALLVPSLHEGNPIGVLESLALGTPVLAAPLPGVGEILADKGGRVQPDRDAARWAERIQAFVRDEAAGTRLSIEARARFLDAFTADAAAVRCVSIYRDALALAE